MLKAKLGIIYVITPGSVKGSPIPDPLKLIWKSPFLSFYYKIYNEMAGTNFPA